MRGRRAGSRVQVKVLALELDLIDRHVEVTGEKRVVELVRVEHPELVVVDQGEAGDPSAATMYVGGACSSC